MHIEAREESTSPKQQICFHSVGLGCTPGGIRGARHRIDRVRADIGFQCGRRWRDQVCLAHPSGGAGKIPRTTEQYGRWQVMSKAPISNQWLAPKELAGHFGLADDSAYRWIADGLIPDRWLKHQGKRRLLVNRAALPHLEQIFKKSHSRRKSR